MYRWTEFKLLALHNTIPLSYLIQNDSAYTIKITLQ